MYDEGLTLWKQFGILSWHSGCISKATLMVTRGMGKKQVVIARDVLTTAPFINFEKDYPKWYEQTACCQIPPLTPARVVQRDVLDCWRGSRVQASLLITKVDSSCLTAITAL